MNLTIENVELWLAALAAIAGLGVWGYKKSHLTKFLMQSERLLTKLKK